MNKKQKYYQYVRQLSDLQISLENIYIKKLRALRRELYNQYASQYLRYRFVNSSNLNVIFAHRKLFIDMTKKIMKPSDMIVKRQIKLLIKESDDVYDEYVNEYIESSYTAAKIVSISNTFLDGVREVIESGISQGLAPSEIASDLRKLVSLKDFEIVRIARTETASAMNYAQFSRAKSLQEQYEIQMYKKWNPVFDKRTRPDHYAMGSHPAIKMDARFNVGGELMDHPHSSEGSSKNVINCRCSMMTLTAESAKILGITISDQ